MLCTQIPGEIKMALSGVRESGQLNVIRIGVDEELWLRLQQGRDGRRVWDLAATPAGAAAGYATVWPGDGPKRGKPT
jgi:hypothetical protein